MYLITIFYHNYLDGYVTVREKHSNILWFYEIVSFRAAVTIANINHEKSSSLKQWGEMILKLSSRSRKRNTVKYAKLTSKEIKLLNRVFRYLEGKNRHTILHICYLKLWPCCITLRNLLFLLTNLGKKI